MAMLLLDRKDSRIARLHARSLHSWLAGDWALLFSHAADFAQCDFEADRWLVLLEQAFTRARIRPVQLSSDASTSPHSWIEEMNGRSAQLHLTHTRSWPHIIDFHARALRDAIAQIDARFVMMIDENLRPRRTFTYTSASNLPSIFDFVATAVRARAQTQRAADQAWDASRGSMRSACH
jgi:hypothetical protein